MVTERRVTASLPGEFRLPRAVRASRPAVHVGTPPSPDLAPVLPSAEPVLRSTSHSFEEETEAQTQWNLSEVSSQGVLAQGWLPTGLLER